MSQPIRYAQSIDPYTNETIKRYNYYTDAQIEERIDHSLQAYETWRHIPLNERIALMGKAAKVLDTYGNQFGKIISREMGKPITQAVAEVKKCAWVCRYYVENASDLLQPETIETDARKSYVRFDPLGPVLAIMPWNYPFWQLFRFAAPNLIAGNTAILKHASNVTGSALELENIFLRAGFPEYVFQTLVARSDQIPAVIKNAGIKAITLTGSKPAGQSVAKEGGAEIKKTVLELGGSNACVVFDDADLDKYIETIVWARYQNTGQSCIAAKRFIVCPGIYDEFLDKFQKALDRLKTGNPAEKDTDIGPMATAKLAEDLKKQMDESVRLGAKLTRGGKVSAAHFEPTILTEVKPGMPAFDEETFGPLAAIIRAKDEDHAISLANHTTFGLGTSLFTEDDTKAEKYIPAIEDGAVFINELVKSDPRLPFGGTKDSGYGRELARAGMREFTNQKTVYFK